MGESLVGFGHLVGFFALANGVASLVGGIHQFASQLLGHAPAVAGTGEAHQPAQSHGGAALLAHFHGHLISGTTNAAGAHFHQWGGVLDSCFEQFERISAGALVDQAERVGQDPLRCRLLAVLHQAHHHHRGEAAVELRVGKNRALLSGVAA